MIKRYGASVSPSSTPATMSKYSVSPSVWLNGGICSVSFHFSSFSRLSSVAAIWMHYMDAN